MGCTVVEQHEDGVGSTVANPLTSTPKIEKGRQNSEMDHSDQMKMQNRLIDHNSEHICEIKSVDNGQNYFKHNTSKHRKTQRQYRRLNCNSIKSIASIRKTLNPSQNNSEQPAHGSCRQNLNQLESIAPGSCSGLNSAANAGNMNKLPLQCHNSFEEEEVIEENIEVEESSNEKASGSRIASIEDGKGAQESKRDLFRIDRLRMVSYVPTACNYNPRNVFDYFDQGQSQDEVQEFQGSPAPGRNPTLANPNHPFNCSAKNSNCSSEEKYHMPFFPKSCISKNNNNFGLSQGSFLKVGLLGEPGKSDAAEQDCVYDLEQNYTGVALHPMSSAH